MIVVDSSALLARMFREPDGPAVEACMTTAGIVALSAGTLVETLIVARRRGVGAPVEAWLSSLTVEIVPVTVDFAGKVGDAYDNWGKGVHPAALNIMDCFAYALAKERNCPLLFVGGDFAQTDVTPALAP